jgi:hypothetical protein
LDILTSPALPRKRHGTRVLADLLSRSRSDLSALVAVAGVDSLLRRDGLIHAYASEAAFAAAEPAYRIREAHGLNVERIGPGALRDLEPGLAAERVSRAVLLPDVGHVRDPQGLAAAFLTAAIGRGAVARRAAVTATSALCQPQYLRDAVRASNPGIAFRLGGANLVGAALGIWAFTRTSPELLSIILGLFLGGVVALEASRVLERGALGARIAASGPGLAIALGLVAGFMTGQP